MQRQCLKASAVCYVTGKFLQQRYPPADTAFCTSFLPIELGEKAFVSAPRTFDLRPTPIRILTIGSMEQPYKGIDVLIDAVASVIAQGHEVHLTIVGRGRYQQGLEQHATLRGVGNHVTFTGEIPTAQLLQHLDDAHLFVLASRTEGLPRVVIEAMARGLPCIGSAVGGIPELLAPDDLVPPGDAVALAGKIVEVITAPARMERMSSANLTRARDYSNAVMDAKRQTFLLHLHRATQHWLTQAHLAGTQ
jgi:glycosyltransferase involved in cell wall biosynthesis